MCPTECFMGVIIVLSIITTQSNVGTGTFLMISQFQRKKNKLTLFVSVSLISLSNRHASL